MHEYWTLSPIPNMKQMKYLALLFMLLIELTACQNELDIPDTGRKIVINGLITTDSLLNLKLSKSAYYNDMPFDYLDLDNAKAYFYEDNILIDSLHPVEHWPRWEFVFYQSNYQSRNVFPKSARKYNIKVMAHGYPDATSSSIVPELVRIIKLDTSRILVGPDPYHPYQNNVLFLCNINFSDPANESNYYMVTVSRNQYFSQITPNVRFYSQDPIIEERLGNFSNETYALAFTDKVINGQNYNLKLSVYGSDFGMPFRDDRGTIDGVPDTTYHKKVVYFSLYSITEDYYRYIQTLNRYKKNYGNPLTEPVLIYSNITGGYGIFGAAAVSSDSIVFHY